MNIGQHLSYLREHNNLSLRDLSALTGGLSIGYLSDIEHGRTTPSIESVEKLAGAFGMSVPVFMGGADLELAPDEQRLIEAYRAGDVVGVMRIMVEKVS